MSRGIVLGIGSLVLVAGGLVLGYLLFSPKDQTKSDSPAGKFADPSPPEEMKVFAPRVGDWKTTLVVKPTQGVPKGFTEVGECKGQLILNGHFLRIEGFGESERGRVEFTSLSTYDVHRKVYRWWYFSSGGNGENTGSWDEKTKTMTWTGVSSAPDETWIVKDTLAQDRVIATVVGKKQDGTILFDADYTAERKK